MTEHITGIRIVEQGIARHPSGPYPGLLLPPNSNILNIEFLEVSEEYVKYRIVIAQKWHVVPRTQSYGNYTEAFHSLEPCSCKEALA